MITPKISDHQTRSRALSVVPGLKRTTWNIGVLWGHKLVSALASFVITGVATRFYGLEQIGIWVIATSVASYLQMLDFGTSSALPRIVPRLRANGHEEDVQRYVSTAFVSTLAIAVIGLLLLPYSSHFLAMFYSMDQAGKSTTQILLGLAILSSLVGLPLRVGYGLLASVHRFDIYFGLDLAAVLLRTILAVAVVTLAQAGIVIFAVAVLVPPLIMNLIQYRAGLRYNKLKTDWRGFSVEALRELLSHSGASFLLTFAAMLLIQGSTLAAGRLSLTAAAIFSFPLLLVIQAMSFGASAGGLVAPIASALGADSDRAHLRDITVGAIRTSSSVAALSVLLLLLAGPLLLEVWLAGPTVDATSLQMMTELLAVFVLGASFIAPGAAVRGVLMGIGRHWEASLIEFIGSVLGLMAGLLMMKLGGLGLSGLAYGLSFAFVLRYMVLLMLAAKEIEMPLGRLVTASAKPFAVGLLGLGAAILLFDIPRLDNGPLVALFSCTIASAIWAIGTWLWILDSAKRRFVATRLQEALAKWL